MRNLRWLFLSVPIACATGCSSSPLAEDVLLPSAARLDGGQTLGAGHRNDGASTTTTIGTSTTTTVPTTTVAANSDITSAFGGQTLGAGH